MQMFVLALSQVSMSSNPWPLHSKLIVLCTSALQGAATLVRAVQTFVDRRGVTVQAHEFGKSRLISAPLSRDESGDGTPSDGDLPPVVSSGAVVITPVQLVPV